MESYITWKEFRDRVEQKIKELGKDENVVLGYIDVSCWLMTCDDPGVFWNDKLQELHIV